MEPLFDLYESLIGCLGMGFLKTYSLYFWSLVTIYYALALIFGW